MRSSRDADWFADEAFWKWSFRFMFPQKRFDNAPAEVEQLTNLAGFDRGRVLDMACGPGRHSVELARRGFEVTGVDRSAFLLDHARRHAESEGARVEWVEDDMRRFRRPDTYDLALSLYTSLGFFERPEDNQTVLENMQVSLRSGGRCVLDVLGKEMIARKFIPSETKELEGGSLLVQRRTVMADWRRLETEWVEIREAEVERFGFRLWIYSGAELRRMLQEAGFGSVKLYGSFEGAPYDLDASRLVALATKA
jgi:SAM-dependent methyltransferase